MIVEKNAKIKLQACIFLIFKWNYEIIFSTKPNNIPTEHNSHLCLNIKYNYFNTDIVR